MRILSMTATFGKLEHAALTLDAGLNIIQAPNEWGKSTWCAFLAAMLYGIDSRAHSATRQGLADKTRYDPWSGQLMSGRMDILWKGREITIERSSTKRSQFREFKAYETHTGTPVPALTAENCGQTLLGVEKEVFQRAGFIRLSDMPVTPNDALRRRLNALVTTGDESGAADRLALQLNKVKNECRANRSHGLLPQAEAERLALSEKLRQLEALRAEAQRLQQQRSSQEAELQTLRSRSDARQEDHQRIRQLQKALADAEEKLAQLRAPVIPEPFQGLTLEAACRQARTDREVYQQACKERRRLPCLLALIPAVLAFLCLLIPHWVGRWLCVCLLLAGTVLFSICQAGRKRAAATAAALLQKYDSAPPEQWEPTIRELLTEQDAYLQTRSALENRRSQLSAEISRLIQGLSDREDAAQAAARCEQQLRQLHLQLGRRQGQMDALGSEADLRQALSKTEARIRKLEDTLAAVELAQRTLQDATAQLQRRFAPRITQRAKSLFSRMTGGRYDRLTLSEDLSLQTAAQNEDILRGSLWRSDGTVDQLYLSLRLAVSAELTPDAPLVLDDALVRFDDDRLKAAMAVLSEEAQSRQVILFTCQSREKNCI